MIDADKILFRASCVSKIMTESQKKSELLGETCKSYLKQLYRELKYDRREEITTKYMAKGLSEEEAAITLLSRINKKFYKKNAERISNDFLTGHPDLYEGENINAVKHGFDTKVSWSLFTFPHKTDKLIKDYYWQDMSYMALTNAPKWTTAFCLLNANPTLIDDEKRRLMWKMNVTDSDPIYIEKCKDLEKNMIFDIGEFKKDFPYYDLLNKEWEWDIPKEERIVTFEVIRDEEAIAAIYKRVQESRDWIKTNLL